MKFQYKVSGRPVLNIPRNCTVLASRPGFHVVLNGQKVVPLIVARGGGGVHVFSRGMTRKVSVRNAVERVQAANNAVLAPLPAVVARVLVAPGDRVSQGQALVVVSAMKVEFTLVAGCDGVVQEVRVKEGEKVKLGQVLVLLSGAEVEDGSHDSA